MVSHLYIQHEQNHNDKSGYEIRNEMLIFPVQVLPFNVAWYIEGQVSSPVLQQASVICGKKGCLWSRVIQTWKAVFTFYDLYI
jgi:hypothetical protein